jgi:hypothetical protein
MAQALAFRIAGVEQLYRSIETSMAQHDAAGVLGARVGGEAGINNAPNMVAEPGAQLPIGGRPSR